MQGSEFDEIAFFRAIHTAGARGLLIGRRVLVLLGLPVLTADYDFWIAMDDIAAFNGAVLQCGLSPTRTPEEARRHGRYAVENDEHVDVLVARAVTTVDGVAVAFDDVWVRRRTVPLEAGVDVQIPSGDDLILTKRFVDRPKDLETSDCCARSSRRTAVSEPDGTPVSPQHRRLSPADARAYLDAPLTEAEREGVLELARWFRRRYPTPVERLAYVRHALVRWRRVQGRAARQVGRSEDRRVGE